LKELIVFSYRLSPKIIEGRLLGSWNSQSECKIDWLKESTRSRNLIARKKASLTRRMPRSRPCAAYSPTTTGRSSTTATCPRRARKIRIRQAMTCPDTGTPTAKSPTATSPSRAPRSGTKGGWGRWADNGHHGRRAAAAAAKGETAASSVNNEGRGLGEQDPEPTYS